MLPVPGAPIPPMIRLAVLAGIVALALLPGADARAQRAADLSSEELISLDFNDVELPVVVDTISRMTGYNFIYDDRVRGRVTIVSPTQVTVEQAFAVFESVLKVKGFSLVLGPGDTYKIIPIRDVKESSIDTIKDGRPSANRDRFVTRLVPLRYIDAEDITNTIKPLISKDASLVAYAPTNTIIVTDSESNIRRLLSILDAIDVESYRQELSVIKIEHADATTLGEQLSEIYGAEVSSTAGGATAAQRRTRARRRAGVQQADTTPSGGLAGPQVRILTDERTNSLLVLSSRQQLADIRKLVEKLDIPVTGGGRIHVYYLRHADAEELSETLNSLLSGASGSSSTATGGAAGTAANVQALRSAITPLAEGVTVTADPATNSLVIQASKEAYETLRGVIERLDVSRPQVLVEALIVEVDVTDRLDLGFASFFRIINGDTDLIFSTGTAALTGGLSSIPGLVGIGNRITSFSDPSDATDPTARPDRDGTSNLSLAISADQGNSDLNIVSAPHILTSDNEEAEIKIGQNIPIVTNRTEAPTGDTDLATAVGVERQDVGVTLRVTPQISEGDTLRLQIFQELTEVTDSEAGDVDEVGVTLNSRKVENTVVVSDGETVVIGGLISEALTEAKSGVPWLSDIPYLGWLFKITSEEVRKINLLVFLTPHIVRSAEDLEEQSIRKRLELEDAVGDEKSFPELANYENARWRGRSAVKGELARHSERYPIDRMRELEAARRAEREGGGGTTVYVDVPGKEYVVRVATYLDETEATDTLTTLLEAGYDGTLVATESDGRLVFNVEIGPFRTLDDAERTATTLDSAYGFSSAVNVLREGAR